MGYSEWKSFSGSSLLSAGRYDASCQKLHLRFLSGKHYEYADVPQSFWWGLCQSESKGVFFNKHIAGSFSYVELSIPATKGLVYLPPERAKRKAPEEDTILPMESYEDPINTYIPPVKKSRAKEPRGERRDFESVNEEHAHELLDEGDFMGAVSIYEQLEEEERRDGDNPEMICYHLYNQVVCLCWAGDYVWAARRAEKLSDYAEKSCDDINSYEFLHSAIDCSVVVRIRSFLDGAEPEPELKLAMLSLQFCHSGASKPDVNATSSSGRGCMVILLAIPIGLVGLSLF